MKENHNKEDKRITIKIKNKETIELKAWNGS